MSWPKQKKTKTQKTVKQLPEGWQQRKKIGAKGKEKVFYVNLESAETRWSPPEGTIYEEGQDEEEKVMNFTAGEIEQILDMVKKEMICETKHKRGYAKTFNTKPREVIRNRK